MTPETDIMAGVVGGPPAPPDANTARSRTRHGGLSFQPAESDWSLDKLPDLQSAYQQSTGKPLPVGVQGQGAIHNRWGLDHRNAADVSLNPATPEGQQFLSLLESKNIPYLAFDRAIPGVATGPHTHVGRPSKRGYAPGATAPASRPEMDLAAGVNDDEPKIISEAGDNQDPAATRQPYEKVSYQVNPDTLDTSATRPRIAAPPQPADGPQVLTPANQAAITRPRTVSDPSGKSRPITVATPAIPTSIDSPPATSGQTGQMNPQGRELPQQGSMAGALHLNEAIAPKVPAGAPRPFAPGEWVDNPDGSWSSEISQTVMGDPSFNGGKATVIPGMWLVNGKPQRVSEDQATEYAKASGLKFPSFESLAAAEKFANDRETLWQGVKPQDAGKVPPLWNSPAAQEEGQHGELATPQDAAAIAAEQQKPNAIDSWANAALAHQQAQATAVHQRAQQTGSATAQRQAMIENLRVSMLTQAIQTASHADPELRDKILSDVQNASPREVMDWARSNGQRVQSTSNITAAMGNEERGGFALAPEPMGDKIPKQPTFTPEQMKLAATSPAQFAASLTVDQLTHGLPAKTITPGPSVLNTPQERAYYIAQRESVRSNQIADDLEKKPLGSVRRLIYTATGQTGPAVAGQIADLAGDFLHALQTSGTIGRVGKAISPSSLSSGQQVVDAKLQEGVNQFRELGAYLQGGANIQTNTGAQAFVKSAAGMVGMAEKYGIIGGGSDALWLVMGAEAALKHQDDPLSIQAYEIGKGIITGLAVHHGPRLVQGALTKVPGVIGELAKALPATTRAVAGGAGFGTLAGVESYREGDPAAVIAGKSLGTAIGVGALSAGESLREVAPEVIASDRAPEPLREIVGKATGKRPVILQSEAAEGEAPRFSSVYVDPKTNDYIAREISPDEASSLLTKDRPARIVPAAEFDKLHPRENGPAQPPVAPLNRQLEGKTGDTPGPGAPPVERRGPERKPEATWLDMSAEEKDAIRGRVDSEEKAKAMLPPPEGQKVNLFDQNKPGTAIAMTPELSAHLEKNLLPGEKAEDFIPVTLANGNTFLYHRDDVTPIEGGQVNAVNQGQQPGSDISKHPGDEGSRTPAESVSSGGDEIGASTQPVQAPAAKPDAGIRGSSGKEVGETVNPYQTDVGDRLERTNLDGKVQQYEVVEPDKRGMAQLRNLETGKIEPWNAYNNDFKRLPPVAATDDDLSDIFDKHIAKRKGETETAPARAGIQNSIADKYRQRGLPEQAIKGMAPQFAKAIQNKDATALKNLLHAGNKNSREIFTEVTGVKLGKTVKASEAAIDAWASGQAMTTPPTKAIDKSVRDHSQHVKIEGDTITVTSYVGRIKAGSYSFPLSEWRQTERHPYPNYPKSRLIEKHTREMDDQPGGPDQAVRIRDAQRYAIDKALKSFAPQSAPPATAGSAIKSAGTETIKGIEDVGKGLAELFSPKSNRLGAGPVFDEETYEKAKPLLIAGMKHFYKAGMSFGQAMTMLMDWLVDAYKMALEGIENMKPYIMRFMADLKAGKIDLENEPTHTTVDANAHDAATSPNNDTPHPTQPQIEAGNYKLGHVRLSGLDISIENPAPTAQHPEGSVREGVDPNGKPWSIRMQSHYGYIRNTEGKDHEHVDIYVKPDTPLDYDGPVFVVNQTKGNGHFDEHKVMLGWPNEADARQGYLDNYEKGWDRIGSIARFGDMSEFKNWLKAEDQSLPATTPHNFGSVSNPDVPALSVAFAAEFNQGTAFRTINDARKFAGVLLGGKVEVGSQTAKKIDEAVELGVVRAARKIVGVNRDFKKPETEAYRDLVELYDQQPNLGVKTSTSVVNQAYSTPIPLAYIGSRLAGITESTTVYEPTAGNGALLIEANPAKINANELDPARWHNLKETLEPARLGSNDATNYVVPKVDVVYANPPFGPLKETVDGKLQSKQFQITDRYTTSQIDHAIALKALEAMKDNGRAVLILGGVNADDIGERAQGYSAADKRAFYFHLYGMYNVVDHFTVNGDLYRKQGAGWPVDVVVIHGRGKSERRLPAADVPRVYDTWDELEGVLNEPYRKLLDAKGELAGAKPGATATSGGSEGEAGANAGSGSLSQSPDGEADLPDRTVGRPGRSDGDALGATGGRSGSVAGIGPGGGKATGGRGASDLPERGSDTEINEPGNTGPAASDLSGEQSASAGTLRGDDTRELDQQSAGEQPKPRSVAAVNIDKPQAPYQPSSKATGLNSLVPVNMKSAVETSLQRLTDRVGDLDKFIADQLGYKLGQLLKEGGPFTAEQIDGAALAIDNIMRDSGMIIGDQGGIGKGRIMAAVIRWAVLQKRPVIFVPEKAGLYKDIVRDLVNIGEGTKEQWAKWALMTNNGESIALDDEGQILLKSDAAKHEGKLDALRKKGSLGPHRVIFTTYSQMQNVVKADKSSPPTTRQQFLRHFAEGAVILFDESHNAAGAAPARLTKAQKQKMAMYGADYALNRAQFARELIAKAHGVVYSSATFAKNPTSMTLYNKINMALAVQRPADLVNAITKGGVPLQQVTASMLAEDGQMIRRERDMSGLTYNTRTVAVDRKVANDIAGAMQIIRQFDIHAQAAADNLKGQLADTGSVLGVNTSTGIAGIVSTSFSSLMHNLIADMAMMLKVDGVVDSTIEALKAGQKPVIVVAKTMGAFIGHYAQEHGLNPGDAIDVGFQDILHRYLTSSRTITVKGPNGESDKHYLTDVQLGPQGVAAFRRAKDFIDNHDWSTLPLSPIDYIKQKVQKAGFSIGEITGREHAIDYGKTGGMVSIPTVKPPDPSLVDIHLFSAKLRNYQGPALKFATPVELVKTTIEWLDQSAANLLRGSEERKEIEESVDTQLFHYVDGVKRFGGAKIAEALGKYWDFKKRSVLARHGVNSATYYRRPSKDRTTNGKNQTLVSFNNNETNAILINESGSTGISMHASREFKNVDQRHMVIAQPHLNIDVFMQTLWRVDRTGQVVLPTYTLLSGDIPAELRPSAVLKGKMSSLNANTTAAKGSAYEAENMPDFMNQYGDQVVAEIMHDNPDIHASIGRPLKANSNGDGLEEEKAVKKVTGRLALLPLTQQEHVYDLITSEYHDLIKRLDAMGDNALEAKTLDLGAKLLARTEIFKGTGDSAFAKSAYASEMEVKKVGKPFTSAQVMEQLAKSLNAKGNTLTELQHLGESHLGELREEVTGRFNEYRDAILDDIEDEEKKRARRVVLEAQLTAWDDTISPLAIGSMVKAEIGRGENINGIAGVITKIEQKGTPKNPVAMGSWKITIAVPDATKQIVFPLSQVDDLSGVDRYFARKDGKAQAVPMMEAFDLGQSDVREMRTIMTGNLFAAFSQFPKGRFINFTDEAGQVQPGIMMANDFNIERELNNKDIVFSNPAHVVQFLEEGGGRRLVNTPDSGLRLQWNHGELQLQTAASKAKGGQYYLNQAILDAAGDEFVKSGNNMQMFVDRDRAEEVIQAIISQRMQLQTDTFKEEARRITGQAAPKTDRTGEAGRVSLSAAPVTGYTPGPVAPGLRGLFQRVRHATAALGGRTGNAKTNYSALGRLRDIWVGGLSQLERANGPAFEAALRAAGARTTGKMLMRRAAQQVQSLLKTKDAWDKFRSFLVEGRLQGVKKRWQDFASLSRDLDDDELKEFYAGGGDEYETGIRPVVAMLEGMPFGKQFKVDQGFDADDSIAGMVDALLATDDINAARSYLGTIFENAADAVASVMSPDEFDEMRQDEDVKKALIVYKDLLERPMTDAHSLNEGVFSDAVGPLDTYYPLTAIDDQGNVLHRVRTRVFRGSEYRPPDNPRNKMATGLSPDYDVSPEALGNAVSQAERRNTVAKLLRTMEKQGLALPLKRKDPAPDTINVMGENYRAKTVAKGKDRILMKDGKTLHLPAPRIAVPEWLHKELQPLLEDDQYTPGNLAALVSKLNLFGMAGPIDAAAHTANVIGALVVGTPFIGPDIASRTIGNTPVTKLLTAWINIVTTDPWTDDAVKDVEAMSKMGLIPSRYGTVVNGWMAKGREFASHTGAERKYFSLAPLLYGPAGIDIRARLLMYRAAKVFAPHASTAELRQFVNMLGNYNFETMGAIEKFLKVYGLAPFFTAGSTMWRTGIKAVVGMTPLPTSHESAGKRGTARAQVMFSAGIVGMLGAWIAMYRAYTGKWPWKDHRARLLQFPLSDKHRQHWLVQKIYGKGTKTAYVGMGMFSPLIERGLRATGVSGYVDARMAKATKGQASENATREIFNSAIHPFVSGPATQAATVAVTGSHPYFTSLRDVTGKENWSALPATKVTRPGVATWKARGVESIANLNSFYSNIARNIGLVRDVSGLEPAHGKHDARATANPWLRMALDLAAPRLIKGPVDVAKQEKGNLKAAKAVESAARHAEGKPGLPRTRSHGGPSGPTSPSGPGGAP